MSERIKRTAWSTRRRRLVLLGVLVLAVAAAGVFAVSRAFGAPTPPTPTITSGPTNNTTVRSAAFSWTEAYGSNLSFPLQGMQGDPTYSTGDWLNVGFELNMAGQHPAATVTLDNNTFAFPVSCWDGSTPTQSTFTVSFPTASVSIPANDGGEYPSGGGAAASTYQGGVQLPALCGSKAGNIRFKMGATYTALLSSTDTTDKVQVQWHYVDANTAKKGSNINCGSLAANPNPGLTVCNGGWSGTVAQVPGTAQSSISFKCQLDSSGFSPCGTAGSATGTTSYTGPLAVGTHTFQVEAIVASVASAPTSYAWTIIKNSPTLSLTGPGNPGAGTAGTLVSASAITAGLSGGYNPTGTITFVYFQQATAPASPCSGGTTIGTANVTANASYHPTAGFTPTVAGNYWLYASYGGDSNNNGAPSACPPTAAQEIVVAKASPTLTLTGPGSPASITVGTPVANTSISAALTNSSGANAGGTINFVYFQQSSAPTTCTSGGTAIGSASVNAGNTTYHPGTGFTPTTPGNYWLYASYTGDGNNNSAPSACPPGAPQEITVVKASPTLALTGPGSPGSGVAGTAVPTSAITATLASGYNSTGTIGFVYFQQSSAPASPCSGGTAIGTTTVNAGNSTYHPNAGFTPTVAGNYWLYASYGGDSNNNSAPSACPPGAAQEIVVVKASPTLTVSAPSNLNAGDSVTAANLTATLAHSSGSNATSTITFTVFGPQASAPATCTSGGTTVGTATPAGDGAYPSNHGFTPDTAGTYWWYVSSTGDANNNSAASLCNSGTMTKTVVAGPPLHLTITGQATGLLYPGGATRTIAITFNNPNTVVVDVSGLNVTVGSTDKPGCAASDFQIVTQSNLTSSNRFTVPANASATIPATGPVSRPTIRMIDNGNQNVCQGAHVTLNYTST